MKSFFSAVTSIGAPEMGARVGCSAHAGILGSVNSDNRVSVPAFPYQQNAPFGPVRPGRVLTLPVERIHPVIRIAHRRAGQLDVAERIIFDHEFVLVLSGEGELVFGRQRRAFAPHDLLFIPPFVRHQFISGGPENGAHIAVHFDFAPDIPARPNAADPQEPYQVRLTQALHLPLHLTLPPGHRIGGEFTALLREWTLPDPLAGTAASAHLLTIIIAALRAGRAAGKLSHAAPWAAQNQAKVALATAYVQAHFGMELRASDLAAAAGLSVSRLSALFRQMTGCSPMEYVQRTRVEEARRLLADVHLSIKEIAARTGFDDAYHFSKVFRRIDGLSPLHYRQALLAGTLASEY